MDIANQIKESIDIVDYIGRIVPLTQRGRNYFGLCPFHSEKTPSFSVNPDMQIFKCFGCGESGDLISFVQKYQHVDFPEALEILAPEAGVDISKFKYSDPEASSKKKLYDLYFRVADFYHKVLLSKHGIKAQKYLADRGFSKTVWKNFNIGYAPKENNFLTSRLKEKYTSKEILESGLTKPGQLSDKFYDRVIFPLKDTRGRVVGFSARIIDRFDKRPKYLNSPETPIFKKRDNLFGLYEASQSIIKKDFVLLVEGQTDVISSHSTGVKNIVAPLGTSLTENQLLSIKKYTDNLYVAFDSDLAGQKALIRTADIAHKKGFSVSAVNIPYGKDIDECIKKDPKLYISAIKSAKNVIEYLLNKLPTETIAQKKRVLSLLVKLITGVTDPVTKRSYIDTVSDFFELTSETIENLTKSTLKEDFTETINEVVHKNKGIMEREKYYLAILIQVKTLRKKSNFVKPSSLQTPVLQKILAHIVKAGIKTTPPEKLESTWKLLKVYLLPSDDLTILEADLKRLVKEIKIRKIQSQITTLKTGLQGRETTKAFNRLIKRLALLKNE
ncbi:DNA primase [Candidatus Dojkabacteria bacterium]|nr:DNA primase [Candidatus Dojkabacteria bacterium]